MTWDIGDTTRVKKNKITIRTISRMIVIVIRIMITTININNNNSNNNIFISVQGITLNGDFPFDPSARPDRFKGSRARANLSNPLRKSLAASKNRVVP